MNKVFTSHNGEDVFTTRTGKDAETHWHNKQMKGYWSKCKRCKQSNVLRFKPNTDLAFCKNCRAVFVYKGE